MAGKTGQWMRIEDNRLIVGRTETTGVTESVMIDAIERITNGETVCVDVHGQMHHAVRRTIDVLLQRDRDDVTHALCNVGAIE
jgi:hydrogenase maturation factor